MWILEFLPEAVLHLLLLASIFGILASFVLGAIPFISQYKIPIQVLSILLLAVTLYLEGGAAEKQAWDAKIKDLETKLAKAEAKSAKVNTEIVTKILTKKQIVKEKGEEVIRYVDREVTKFDETCPIPKSVVNALNAAALNKTVDELIDTNPINEAAKPPLKLPKK